MKPLLVELRLRAKELSLFTRDRHIEFSHLLPFAPVVLLALWVMFRAV